MYRHLAQIRVGTREWLVLLGLLRRPELWSVEDDNRVFCANAGIWFAADETILFGFDHKAVGVIHDDNNRVFLAIRTIQERCAKEQLDTVLVAALLTLDEEELPTVECDTTAGIEAERRRQAAEAAAARKAAEALAAKVAAKKVSIPHIDPWKVDRWNVGKSYWSDDDTITKGEIERYLEVLNRERNDVIKPFLP